MRRKLVVGNWKMNGSRLANTELLAAIDEAGPFGADVAVCPPFPYLSEVALSLQGKRMAWGAQDGYARAGASGACAPAHATACGDAQVRRHADPLRRQRQARQRRRALRAARHRRWADRGRIPQGGGLRRRLSCSRLKTGAF